MGIITSLGRSFYFLLLLMEAVGSLWSFSEPAEGLEITGTITNATCEEGGKIDVTVTGAEGNYTFYWTGNNLPDNPGLELEGLLPGAYTITVTDETGESVPKVFEVGDESEITVIPIPQKTATFQTCSAEVTVEPPGVTCSIFNTPIGTRDDNKSLDDPYDVGTTTITWTVTDVYGKQVEAIQEIKVTDDEGPVIVPGSVDPVQAYENCETNVNVPKPVVTDNCSDNLEAKGIRDDGGPLNAPYPYGTTTITWIAIDEYGNPADSTKQKIIVIDDLAPIITAGNDIEIDAEEGKCGATVNITFATATDNCDIDTLTGIRSDSLGLEEMYPVGLTTITWTAVDVNGKKAEKVQKIYVRDLDPVAKTQDRTIYLDAHGNAVLTPDLIDDGSYDDCGEISLSLDRTNFTCEDAGKTFEITLTVEDKEFNTDWKTAMVTVEDIELPVISAGENITISTDPDTCGAIVNIPPASASDNCTVGNPTGTRSDGEALDALYPVGTTTITWTATDVNSNDALSVEQTIVVTDDELPVITAKSDINTIAEPEICGAILSIIPASVTDNCNVVTPTGTRDDGKALDELYPVGTTTIIWTFKDENENEAVAVEQTVNVKDEELPVITTEPPINTTTDLNSCDAIISIIPATATDHCTVGAPTGTRSDGLALNEPYPIGTTTITWTVTDVYDNEALPVEQTVTVEDNELPVITAEDNINTSTDPGSCGASVTNTPATATDNCLVGNPTGTRSDGLALNEPYPVGTTTITWKVIDDNDNAALPVEQTITVEDIELPIITVGENINTSTDPYTCGASVTIPPATAADNCTVGVPIGTRSDGEALDALYPVGTTTITWTVTDDNNNEAVPVEQTVVVTDDELPVITAESDINTTTDPELCGATVTINSAIVADNCNVETPTGTRDDGKALDELYPVGTTTIIWTFTDENGNEANAVEQLIIVEDNELPVIVAGEDIDTTSDPNSCNASVTFTPATATDNCIVGAPNGTRSDGLALDEPFPIGITTITWIVTDENNNEALPVEQTIIVEDNELPVITAEDNMNTTTDPGSCSASVTITPATAADNCLVGNPTGTRSDGLALNEPYPIGTTTITWEVTDENDNEAVAVTQTILVEDKEIPIITAGNNIETTTDTGICGTNITVTPATVTDNCTVGEPIGTRSDGKALTEIYPLGTTTITWKVTDNHKNEAVVVTQTILVEDKEAPIPPTITPVIWGCEYTITDFPVAIDNCAGEITGTTTDSLTISNEGENIVTWTFDDGNGNIITADQKITIIPIEQDIEETKTTKVSCSGLDDGAFEISVYGGVGNLSYSIGDSFQSSPRFEDLIAGTYNVRVRDMNGCEKVFPITVSEPDPLTMEVAYWEPVTCFGGSDGKIIAGAVSGGTPNPLTQKYRYTLDNINYNDDGIFEGIPAGRHYLKVVDENDCTFEVPVDIPQKEQLHANIGKTDILCHGHTGSISFTGSTGGSGSYLYSIDDRASWFEDPVFGDLVADVEYDLWIKDKDANCELFLETVTLNQPEELTIQDLSFTRTREYGSATASASVTVSGGVPGYTYNWEKWINGTWTDINQYTRTPANLSAGEYRVTVTDQNGCSVTPPNPFEILETTSAEIITLSWCEDVNDTYRTTEFSIDEESVIGGVGDPENFTYIWDFGDDVRYSEVTRNEETITNPPTDGRYAGNLSDVFKVPYTATGDKIINLWIIDEEGVMMEVPLVFYHQVSKCYTECGNAQDVNFAIDSFFVGKKVTVNGQETWVEVEDCNDNSEKFLIIDITKVSKMVALTAEIRYSITSNGITTEQYITGKFTSENTQGNKSIPEGLFPLFSVGEGKEIDWSCGEVLKIIFANFSWDKNSNGNGKGPHCIGINMDTTVQSPLAAQVTPTNVQCYSYQTGSIYVNASGGSGDYTITATKNGESYNLTAGTTTFHNLGAGHYTISITDGHNNFSETVEVTEPSQLTATINKENPTCYYSDPQNKIRELGRAWVPNASGGTGNYTYQWNDMDNSTGPSANLLPGNYTVTITDENNCSLTLPVEIEGPQELSMPDAGKNQTLGCGFSAVVLDANAPEMGYGEWSIVSAVSMENGSAIGYEKVELDKADPKSLFRAPQGIYTLHWTISDNNGECAVSDEVVITILGDCERINFDGENDYVEIGDYYDLTEPFTIEVWVRPLTKSGSGTILSKRDWRAPSSGYELSINNSTPSFRWSNNSLSTAATMDEDRWYHLAVVYNGAKVNLYVDGISKWNTGGNGPIATPYPLILGGMYDSNNPDTPTNLFHGWMEELRIWDKALTEDQLHLIMNQRIEKKIVQINSVSTEVAYGNVLKDIPVPGSTPEEKYLEYKHLVGYYPLKASVNEIVDGTTPNEIPTGPPGYLRNVDYFQVNSAPLPYVTESPGQWWERSTWDSKIGTADENWWTFPNDTGINGDPISWNIARVLHSVNSGNKNITVLGLVQEKDILEMTGKNPEYDKEYYDVNKTNKPGTGNALTVTHYLKLDGIIKLNGESQLVQSESSILTGKKDEHGNYTGAIHKDQQGTQSSFNYNYWSSPVSNPENGLNGGYSVGEVMRDGSNQKRMDFNLQYHWADFHDYSTTSPIRISAYWMYKFFGEAGNYSQWSRIGPDGHLKPGEGYTMKGTNGDLNLDLLELQNYTFVGFPNNGTIKRVIDPGQMYLVGNPYPSAIDANEFISDNLEDERGFNVFNGSIYFWHHFGGHSHYLQDYVGGYATYNLSGGVEAMSTDERINNDPDENGEYKKGDKIPQRYIPVGQAFYVNSTTDNAIKHSETEISGGEIIFSNSQRVFVKEGKESSVFHSMEPTKKQQKEAVDNRIQIRLKFHSPMGFHRPLLVTADSKASNSFDIGYDAPLIENIDEDMYWFFKEAKFVIQGVGHFNKDQVLPMGLKIAKEGQEFTISLGEGRNIPDAMNIYLKDKYLEVIHDLRSGGYTSTSVAGEFNDRFELVFQDEEPPTEEENEEQEEETGEGEEDQVGDEDEGEGKNEEGEQSEDTGEETPGEEVLQPESLDIYFVQQGREIVIENPDLIEIEVVHLSNILGQLLQSFRNIPLEPKINLPVQDLEPAVYLATMKTKYGVFTKKIILE